MGWGDDYDPHLEGQQIDVTGLPAGVYVLRHPSNPERRLRESSYANNSASLRLRLTWPNGRRRAAAGDDPAALLQPRHVPAALSRALRDAAPARSLRPRWRPPLAAAPPAATRRSWSAASAATRARRATPARSRRRSRATGRYVAFVSAARNLSSEDRDGVRDVFVRDLTRRHDDACEPGERSPRARPATATRCGRGSPRAAATWPSSPRPATSAPRTATDRTHVYVRDLRRARTVLVSRANGRRGAVASAHATGASISADGRLRGVRLAGREPDRRRRRRAPATATTCSCVTCAAAGPSW